MKNHLLQNQVMQNLRVSQMSFKGRSGSMNKPMGAYADQMHQQWRRDPLSVDQTWADHFSGQGQSAGADLSAIVRAIQ